DDRDTCLDCEPDLRAREIQSVRQPVRLECDARFERDLERALEVESVRRPVVDDPALRVTERAHRRMAHRLRHLARQLVALLPLPGVLAALLPIALVLYVS